MEGQKNYENDFIRAMTCFPPKVSDAGGQVLPISMELIGKYIEDLREKGLRARSLDYCRNCLNCLYCDLPENKILDKNNLLRWRNELYKQDFSWRPINNKLSVVNGFLEYLDREDLKISLLLHPKTGAYEELTREDYLRLLQTAKMHVNERLYLLIKVLCCTGVLIQELHMVTIELLSRDQENEEDGSEITDFINLPDQLRKELLEYAEKKKIETGPIFITQRGIPLDHSNVRKGIKFLCEDAGVSKNKIKAVQFNMLYYQTFTELQRTMGPLAELAYDRLLAQEEQTIGWRVGRAYGGSYAD